MASETGRPCPLRGAEPRSPCLEHAELAGSQKGGGRLLSPCPAELPQRPGRLLRVLFERALCPGMRIPRLF